MTTAIVPLIVLTFVFLSGLALTWTLVRENRQLESENAKLRGERKSLRTTLRDTVEAQITTQKKSDFCRIAGEFAPDGIVVQNMAGQILWSNPAFGKIHKRSASEVLGKHPLEFARPCHLASDGKNISDLAYGPDDLKFGRFGIVQNQRSDGELFWNQISVAFSKSSDGQDIAIHVCRDVTEQVEQTNKLQSMRQQLEHDVKHDELTGASNRTAFHEYFDEVVGDPGNVPVGILHIDLDNFKDINDKHGHAAGDAVLVHVTELLQGSVRSSDMVSRIGGDEFVITCPRTPELGYLADVSAHLLEKLSVPLKWGDRLISCQASIGAALSSDDCAAEALLARADFALYEAKRGGRNHAAIYDEAMQSRHETIALRSSEFADALETEALDCFFQPKIDLSTGKVVGVEALVRWEHAKDGLIAPDEFLPIAQSLGLMADLDFRSMSFALQEKAKLTHEGYADVGIAFNASADLLSHPDFFDRLTWEVDQAGIQPAQVTVEVLETTEIGRPSENSLQASTIQRLHEAGFQVHLDDFGVGFAGLSHLATLHVTGVKLDRGLVGQLASDKASRKIVQKIIELSKELALTITAEGVEDAGTADMLQDMGCDAVQGFWVAKPMPAQTLHAWLELRRRRLSYKTA